MHFRVGLVLVGLLAACGPSNSLPQGNGIDVSPKPTVANLPNASIDSAVHQVSLTWKMSEVLRPDSEGEFDLDFALWLDRRGSWWTHDGFAFDRYVECGFRVLKRQVDNGVVWALLEGDSEANARFEKRREAAMEASTKRLQVQMKADEAEEKRVSGLPWGHLRVGMSQDDVKSILGPPTRTTSLGPSRELGLAGSVVWHYGKYLGLVEFTMQGTVLSVHPPSEVPNK